MPRPYGTPQELERRRTRAVEAIQRGESPTTIARVLGVHVTQLFSLRKNAIAKEPGSSYFKPWQCVSRLGLANGGLDSFESSPYVTLSWGAFSASSLVTPIRALRADRWFPFATMICD
jgi:hypothetical protein